MKLIKKLFFIILLVVSYNTSIAQNLDSMPVDKRDSIIISISKEIILKYGSDYYREYSLPMIERSMVPLRGESNPSGINAGRVAYVVTFLYDKTEETLEWDYTAKVSIWADTGNPCNVMFGNGFAKGITEGADWRNDTKIEPVPYQESIVPLYDINNPDTNQEPRNKDELIRKGYERKMVEGREQWERTRPDTPPAEAQRVIRQAKEDMRSREINKR